jgi:cytochrome c nitrite reductase small subunit
MNTNVLRMGVAVLVGLAVGLGGFTFIYAKGASYLTNDPEACANCHVMQEQLEGWLRSSHRSVARCNDCHTPHNPVGKYFVKAQNGFRHSLAFTSGLFHEPIQIHPFNQKVTEHACRRCHEEIVQSIDASHGAGQEMSCIHCHRSVGHLH